MTTLRSLLSLAVLAALVAPVSAVSRPLAAGTLAVSASQGAGTTFVARAAAGQTVSGTVSGSDSGFLTGARVTLEGKTRHEATTDADGRFTLTSVPSGTYALKVMAPGHVPMENRMEVGDVSVSVDIVLLHIPGL